MSSTLTIEELAWFTDNFMEDFAKTCIAYENFSGAYWERFYGDFLKIFEKFLKERKGFDYKACLNETYNDFKNLIESSAKYSELDISSLFETSLSGKNNIDILRKFREMEER